MIVYGVFYSGLAWLDKDGGYFCITERSEPVLFQDKTDAAQYMSIQIKLSVESWSRATKTPCSSEARTVQGRPGHVVYGNGGPKFWYVTELGVPDKKEFENDQ